MVKVTSRQPLESDGKEIPIWSELVHTPGTKHPTLLFWATTNGSDKAKDTKCNFAPGILNGEMSSSYVFYTFSTSSSVQRRPWEILQPWTFEYILLQQSLYCVVTYTIAVHHDKVESTLHGPGNIFIHSVILFVDESFALGIFNMKKYKINSTCRLLSLYCTIFYRIFLN